MPRKKAIKVGDIVYAVNAKGKVIEATVKAINKKDDWAPYELNLDTKARFFTRDELFNTRDEATVAAIQSVQNTFHEKMAKGQNFAGDQDADYDEETHTFLAPTGERISEFFQLDEEAMNEYRKLTQALLRFCEKHSAPYFGVLCTNNEDNGSYGLALSSLFPGPRTPDIFDALEDLTRQAMRQK